MRSSLLVGRVSDRPVQTSLQNRCTGVLPFGMCLGLAFYTLQIAMYRNRVPKKIGPSDLLPTLRDQVLENSMFVFLRKMPTSEPIWTQIIYYLSTWTISARKASSTQALPKCRMTKHFPKQQCDYAQPTLSDPCRTLCFLGSLLCI